MIYLYISAGLFAVYYFRRYWLTPWATFVSLSETKKAGAFLTVRHVAWYPPFLSFDATYHLGPGRNSYWSDAKTGRPPLGVPAYSHEHPSFHQQQLACILEAARARAAETEELLATTKVSE